MNVIQSLHTTNGTFLLFPCKYRYKSSINVQHEPAHVPKRETLKVAFQIWESPPWQLAFTRPQLAERQDTWEPLTHLERGLPGPGQRGVYTADCFCSVKPIVIGLKSHKYPQCLFPERTHGDKYYEGRMVLLFPVPRALLL